MFSTAQISKCSTEWLKCPSGCHRARSVLEDWWDPKVWLWIRMDISSRWIIRPAVSLSSNQMGSWWRSSEPEEHQTDTLQVLCNTSYHHFINDVSYRKVMMLPVSRHVVGPDLRISFVFHTLQECWFEQISFIKWSACFSAPFILESSWCKHV